MAGDLAQLGIQIDSSQAKAASGDLDRLTASAAKADAATASLGATNAATAKATDALRAAMASGAAVTADQIKAVGGFSAAQKIMAESSTTTARAVASAAETQVAANDAVAASAVESAAVQVAAGDAIKVNSLGMRESLVLLREAARGNFTRMAGSASILIQSFGLLEAAINVLAPIIAVVGGAFLLGWEQVRQSTGDLTKGLNLTADQLDKVKDKTVTLWDTVKATFQVLAKDLTGPINGIGSVFTEMLDNIAKAMETDAKFYVGAFGGAYSAIVEIWNNFPKTIGDAFVTAENFALTAIQGLVNGAISGVNVLIDAIRSISVPGSAGAGLKDIGLIDLGQVKNVYAGAGKSAADAFAQGFNSASGSVDKFFSDVAAQARKNRIAEILKEAGKAPKTASDHQADAAQKQLAEAQNMLKTQTALNAALASGSLTLADYNKQQFVDAQLKGIIAQRDADIVKANSASTSAVERAKTAADAVKLTSVIGELRTLYGQIYDQKQIGEQMVAVITALDGPLEKYLETLKAVQALQNSGRITGAQGNLALSETPLYKSTASTVSSISGNPFGASSALSQAFDLKSIQNNATQYSKIIENAEKAGIISAQEAANARVAIEQTANDKILQATAKFEDAKLALGQDTFDKLATGLGDMFGKQSAAYKVAFGIEKAFQIARATLALETSIAQAAAAPWPVNIPAIAAAIADAGQILSAVASVSANGFMAGGYTGSGPMNAIAGVVHGQEWVTNASNVRGNVNTLAAMHHGAKFDGAGSGTNVHLEVVHDGSTAIRYERVSDDHIRVIAKQEADHSSRTTAVDAVAASQRNPNGTVAKAMRDTVNAKRLRT